MFIYSQLTEIRLKVKHTGLLAVFQIVLYCYPSDGQMSFQFPLTCARHLMELWALTCPRGNHPLASFFQFQERIDVHKIYKLDSGGRGCQSRYAGRLLGKLLLKGVNSCAANVISVGIVRMWPVVAILRDLGVKGPPTFLSEGSRIRLWPPSFDDMLMSLFFALYTGYGWRRLSLIKFCFDLGPP